MKNFLKIFCIFSMSVFVQGAQEQLKADVTLHSISVKKGDTLHKISNKYLSDPSKWPKIYRYNSSLIKDPNLILPDMKIYVPVELIKDEFLKAFVVEYRKDVRIRRKGALEWENIDKGSTIYVGDTIRTAVNSYISIKFEGQSSVRIGENSFVIVKRKTGMTNELELKAGQVRSDNVRILCYESFIEPQTGYDNDFVAEVLSDKSAKVSVLTGKVNVTGMGKTITLDSGQYTRLDSRQGPGKVLALVADNMNDRVGILVEQEQYRLQISGSDNFQEIIYSGKYSVGNSNADIWNSFCRTEFDVPYHRDFSSFIKLLFSAKTDIPLPDGKYYWRLVFKDTLDMDSYSDTLSFIIDSKAPELKLLCPGKEKSETREEMVLIKGKISEIASVYVNGSEAELSDMSFFRYLRLDQGENIVKITAEDKAGNSSSALFSITYNPAR
jgi:hypothetical protein